MKTLISISLIATVYAKKKSHGHIVKHVIENQEEYEKKVKEYEK